MSAAEEKKINIEDYDEEDRKLLVTLLNEYSEKLSVLCLTIDTHSYKEDLLIASVFAPIGILLFIIAPLFYSMFYYMGISFYVNNIYFILVLTILISSILATYFLKSLEKLRRHQRQEKSIIWDAKVLAKKLEKIIIVVSQMQEHSSARLSRRIEMDLRLADAELVLGHYESTIQKTSFMGDLTNFLRTRYL
jgi:hypothetical protein